MPMKDATPPLNDSNNANVFYRIQAGVLGGTLETVIRQPITAIQTYAIANKCPPLHAISRIYEIGGFLKFYDGIQGFAIGSSARALHRTGVFLINDALSKHNVPTVGIALLGTIYEVAVTGVSDTILTVTQSQSQKSSVVSPIDAFSRHIKQHGWAQLLGAGLAGSSLRNFTFMTGYLAPGNIWPEFKQEQPVTMGVGSGMLATIISHPFEVMRIRQVSEPNKSFITHIIETGKKGIVKEFSRGLVPRLASAGLGSAVSYATYARLTSGSSERSV